MMVFSLICGAVSRTFTGIPHVMSIELQLLGVCHYCRHDPLDRQNLA